MKFSLLTTAALLSTASGFGITVSCSTLRKHYSTRDVFFLCLQNTCIFSPNPSLLLKSIITYTLISPMPPVAPKLHSTWFGETRTTSLLLPSYQLTSPVSEKK
mmetsp:Transcript_8788/g.10156  ORF Transcript_8788/g.10156 Transcript_8788/m.10156 type:complete len:103 (+) Transcript_8788:73-381(+)